MKAEIRNKAITYFWLNCLDYHETAEEFGIHVQVARNVVNDIFKKGIISELKALKLFCDQLSRNNDELRLIKSKLKRK